MDSPAHLAQLEPLYAIRPLYLRTVSVFALLLAPQKAINAVSALCLALIAILAYSYTGTAVYSGLLVMSPTIVILGRLGGPDALSTLVVAGACVALLKDRMLPGILLLMISVWIRTDNVLFVFAMLGWLVWKRKLSGWHAISLGALAMGSVEYINYFSGNYGWRVLMHYSFVGGRHPSQITTGITLSQYLRTFFENAESLFPQLAPFALLGTMAWRMSTSYERDILVPVLMAGIAHYLLFPSGESRYFVWACLVTGLVFIRSMQARASARVLESRARAVAA